MPDLAIIIGSGPSLKDFEWWTLNDDRFWTVALNAEIARNREWYVPDAWVLNDRAMADRARHLEIPNETAIHPPIDLVMSYEKRGPLPVWWDRIAPHSYHVRYTLATAAVEIAVERGFTEIALLGCDCQGAYYDPKQPGKDWYNEYRHQRVINRWGWLAQKLPADVNVYQCCQDSPLEVFEKRPFTSFLS